MAVNLKKMNKTVERIKQLRIITMEKNRYLRPAWTYNGSVRTDLPLTVVTKADKKKVAQTVQPGQLFCIGKVYLRTHDGSIRIK